MFLKAGNLYYKFLKKCDFFSRNVLKFSYLVLPCILLSWICLLVGQRERGYAEVVSFIISLKNLVPGADCFLCNVHFSLLRLLSLHCSLPCRKDYISFLIDILTFVRLLYETLPRSLVGSVPFGEKESQTTLSMTPSAASKVAIVINFNFSSF